MAAVHTRWSRVILVGVGLVAVIGVIVIAFLWPSVTASAKNLPVAVAGPSAQTSVLEKAIDKKSPGTFDFTTVRTRAAAVHAIEKREQYGAIVLGDSPEVLYATAASPVAAQILEGLAPALQQQLTQAAVAAGAPATTQVTVKATNVVPLSSSDPRGAVLAASLFPIVLGGMIGGIGITFVIVGVWRRVTATVLYAALGGFALAGILQGWFGGLEGNYFANAGALALAIFAISSVIVGFVSIVGRPGVAIGPVLFLLIANPLSSANSPMEFTPAPWGAVGQWFPPGAAVSLLRDLSYFPKADAAFPWLVLAGWAVLGLILSTVGHFRDRGDAGQFALADAETGSVRTAA